MNRGPQRTSTRGRGILIRGKARDGEKPLQAGGRRGGKERQRKANLPGIVKTEAEVLTGPEMRGP